MHTSWPTSTVVVGLFTPKTKTIPSVGLYDAKAVHLIGVYVFVWRDASEHRGQNVQATTSRALARFAQTEVSLARNRNQAMNGW